MKNKFLITITLLVLIPTAFTCFYFYINISVLLNDLDNKEMKQSINQINTNIESIFKMVDNASNLIILNPIIRNTLESKDLQDDPYLIAQNKSTILNQISYLMVFNYAWERGILNSVSIFSNSSTDYTLSKKTVYHTETLHGIYNALSKDNIDEALIIPPLYTDNTIYFVRSIIDYNTLDVKGKLILGIDESILFRSYNDSLQSKDIITFIIDCNGTIISHSAKNNLGRKVEKPFSDFSGATITKEVEYKDQIYIVTSKMLSEYNRFDLTSIVAFPKNQILSRFSQSINKYLYIIIELLCLTMVFGFLISTRVTKPITELMKNLKQVKEGNFKTQMPPYKELDLNQLSETFNAMTNEIHHLISQVYEKQLLLKESELKSLQAQINPHFMFNVLGSIGWHAKFSGNETLYTMINTFSQMLQANIYLSGYEKTIINHELKYIEFYLYLQKMRFQEKLSYVITVEEKSLMDFYIPKLCIQPIVENAVVHGLEPMLDDGMLEINIKAGYNTVIFEIKDNGIGFDSNLINLDNSSYLQNLKEGHSNIGLFNTNKRLKLFYGEDYGITIESEIGTGSKITVTIPQDKGDV